MVYQRAKVARFYGWTDKDIMTMPMRTFKEYFRAIEPLEAQEKLSNLDLSSFAYWKKDHQKKLRSQLQQTLRRRVDRTGGKLITAEELFSKD